MADTVAIDALVDLPALEAWLDDNIPELGDKPLKAKLVHGGTSNVIVSLDRGRDILMLRRPPVVPPPRSEKTIMREARVLAALNGTNVPHPRLYGRCEDASVIGAPFYVMELVEGWAASIIDDKIVNDAPFNTAPYEYGIAYAMIDGLVALANVDYKAVGLEGFGKPDNFLERQVDRWESQINSYAELYNYAGRDLPGYTYARDWLRENTPPSFKVGIIHGDVGTPNALFAFDAPARLTALIDWELSTIGDPLLDFTWFTGRLRDENAPSRIDEGALYNVANMPTRQELARYYAAGTGRDISNLDYYYVLARYKAGCILEYKVAQAAAGILPKKTGEFFSKLVLESFSDAEKIARQAG